MQNIQQDDPFGKLLRWRTWCVLYVMYQTCSHNLAPTPELMSCTLIIVCSPLTLHLLSDPSTPKAQERVYRHPVHQSPCCTTTAWISHHAAQSLLGSVTLHAANKPGMPIVCCPITTSFCISWVCCCRHSQRCCLRGLWRRAPPSRSRLPSLTPQALQTLMTPPSSWNSGVQPCLPI